MFTSELWRLSQNREGVSVKTCVTVTGERVKVMRENKKTRADSTAVDNFLGKCCPRADSYPVAITIVSKTEWSRARGASEEFMGGEERKPFFL